MNDTQLTQIVAELQELHAKTTPGEWHRPYRESIAGGDGLSVASVGNSSRSRFPEQRVANARFIAAAHNYMPQLLAALAQAETELRRLRGFAKDILSAWPDGDVDCGELQEAAIKHGLLIETKPLEPCSEEGCSCAEFYDRDEFKAGKVTCYRRSAILHPSTQPTEPSHV